MPLPIEGQPGHLQKHADIDTLIAGHTNAIAAGDVTNPASAAGVALSATFVPQSADVKRARALRRFWSALAQAGTTPANVLTLSDSIFEGYNLNGGAPFTHAQRPTAHLLENLRRAWQPQSIKGGRGYLPVQLNGMAQSLVTDWPFAGLADGYGYYGGLGIRSVMFSPTSGVVTITVRDCTSVDLATKLTNGATPGSLLVSVDGAYVKTITITASAETVSANQDFQLTRVTLPNAGSHTITIADDNNWAALHGAVFYNGDENAGIRMYEGGHGAWGTGDYNTPQQLSWIKDQAARIQPALVIYELGSNTSTQFNSDTAAILAAIRAGCTLPPSIILVGMPHAGASNQYMRDLAATDNDMVYWDSQRAIAVNAGGYPFSAGDLLIDGLHLSPRGAQVIASGLAGFALPSGVVGEAETGWKPLTLLNGWSNYGFGWSPAEYWKDPHGIVHLRGVISGGSAVNGTTLFTLPVGIAPIQGSMNLCYSNVGGSSVWANPGGNVDLHDGGNAFFSLAGVSFKQN